ncbi:invasion associated locus B family protein [Pseudovibrio sp. Tun.PSC04-5.I4]|uniref:invasion associated locus B family protein n=1 Tax=Pseudovibrio sp. Tun.PSC04-5.I4 TaxID=1798213 RepID=UPI0008917F3E|nr:invasion associated locus B family protein [Pseudovibrio sp. Tun.PSC04-5.I4]SDR45017.1 Invasion protein IalB, involved in pathogenesis [Pseudovibrio sp. Tun.PSC04-5.I4]
MSRLVVVPLAMLLIVGLAFIVPGLVIAGSQPVADTFADWQVDCGTHLQDGSSQCLLVPNRGASTIETDQFQLVIAPGKPRGTSYAVMSVPNGVYLAPGILLTVDAQRPFKVLYEVCNSSGCHAGFKLTSQVLKALRRGKQASVRVWLHKGRVVDFPVSLSGFTKAYSHYQTQVVP